LTRAAGTTHGQRVENFACGHRISRSSSALGRAARGEKRKRKRETLHGEDREKIVGFPFSEQVVHGVDDQLVVLSGRVHDDGW
jgi:hypothetical protein